MTKNDLIAYGKNVVENIIINRPKLIKRLFILKGNSFTPSIFSTIKKYNILWESLDKDIFIKMLVDKKSVHQGYLAILKDFEYAKFSLTENQNIKTILMLDKIHDPHNFGAIIRSSSLLGVDAIIMKDINQVDVTSSVIKASSGTIYNIPIIKVKNLSSSLDNLKKKGFWIYASALNEKSVSLNTINIYEKKVIILGNEGEGISNNLLNNSDFVFKIKTTNVIDSLNVSVACGIILYNFFINRTED
ncbi:23S rRNA (guanosine(2251)-2'-O)-methyltransferase RlmB [Spiroplasma turonicum]|uniref:tRNA/rRNA methyltransferase n=1 Tax=Spiroplasma turonicum TaxID=216946 RepID=A0A0K1P5S9_9MOLU|nr:23S rRNA (guanosine(2251)-2'-O)-methyltransferase RlmB [Spiroplasma turonicum]AKU79277.1 tRNA/rRNA methyltransferase [Spiroplasma turonicum]ALX70300.1 23S rRNA (guanosine2251-2'-O)-methyltransferase [Spiroplasma turonicum]